MTSRRLAPVLFTTVLALATAGCGPSISVMRSAYAPPRAPNCELTILNGAMQNPMMLMMPDSEYEMLGTIAMGDTGAVDPFSPEYVAILRPRACGLGGDAVSLMMSAQTSGGAMGIGGGTGTAYVVMRKRAQRKK